MHVHENAPDLRENTPNATDLRTAEAFSVAERTKQSLRAEQAYRDWNQVAPSQRPLAVGRRMIADLFDAVLRERWLRNDLSASNVALAERYLGISEKVVRQWREDSSEGRSMPTGALMVMPLDLVEEFVERLLDLRNGGRSGRRGITMIRRAIPKLRSLLVSHDRYEAMRVLMDLQKTCGDLIAELAKEPEKR